MLNHIRGKLLHATLAQFVVPGAAPVIFVQSVDTLPSFLRVTPFDRHGSPITGLAPPLDPDAMVWHNQSIVDITRRLTWKHGKTTDFSFVPLHVDGGWWVYAITNQLGSLPISDTPNRWTQRLPSLEQLVSNVVWPSVADVFCANSSSVHNHFRLPVLTKHGAQELVDWGSLLQNVDDNDNDNGENSPSTPGTTASATFVPDDCGRIGGDLEHGIQMSPIPRCERPDAHGAPNRRATVNQNDGGACDVGRCQWMIVSRPHCDVKSDSHLFSCSNWCNGC